MLIILSLEAKWLVTIWLDSHVILCIIYEKLWREVDWQWQITTCQIGDISKNDYNLISTSMRANHCMKYVCWNVNMTIRTRTLHFSMLSWKCHFFGSWWTFSTFWLTCYDFLLTIHLIKNSTKGNKVLVAIYRVLAKRNLLHCVTIRERTM